MAGPPELRGEHGDVPGSIGRIAMHTRGTDAGMPVRGTPMAEPMADNVYLMRAQRMLAIRQYVTTLCVRHKALVHAEEESRRYAHHLGMLTPLRKSMRDYIEHAMHAALRSLRATQWELAFVACRLDFLRAEQCLLERHLHHHYV